MKTEFSPGQLADPLIGEANAILRKCVHCGFCLATCPTYVVLGDERDSPRGRIYLMKNMLEQGGAPSPVAARHVDRCLSCLACETTCPSGVDYRRLVDHTRAKLHDDFPRPAWDRFTRAMVAATVPHPGRFRLALLGAKLARPFASLFGKRIGAMISLAPKSLPLAPKLQAIYPAQGERRMRVALLTGCAQTVLRPAINDATIRLLTRLGCEVVVGQGGGGGSGCCGSFVYHLGREDEARAQARTVIGPWIAEADAGGLDAVISNTSGCGTMLKDYAHFFKDDPEWAEKAARIAGMARDVSEVIAELGPLSPSRDGLPAIAYQDACSLQHGQQVTAPPRRLLAEAGFEVRDLAEPHLCCGSAGTYNLLQPDISMALRERKLAAIAASGAAAVATANIGCLAQIASGTDLPIAHTVEWLDWATGGEPPPFDGNPGN